MEEHTPSAPGEPGLRVAAIADADTDADPYVEAVLPEGVTRVGGGVRWLDPEHLAAHAAGVDVVHLHARCDHLAAGDLRCWTETLRRTGVPLVVTVHQLAGPEPATAAADLADVLATAEVVLTLTPGAADEIAERSGRTAIVVAHPSIARPVPGIGGERGVVGLVLGPPGGGPADPVGLVRAAQSGAVSGGGRLRVLAERAAVPAGVREAVAAAGAELVEVPRDGTGRAAALQELHVAVLPERCGTHSRDLEVCRDVGTRVVVPGCGWFAEQWSDVVPYAVRQPAAGEPDPVALAGAVAAALARPAPRPADRDWRDRQLAAVRDVHAQVYASVAGDRLRVPAPPAPLVRRP